MVRGKFASYAVLAVVEIARREDLGECGVRSGVIARLFGIPTSYIAKIMTQLKRAGLLDSERGPCGGYRLARPPESINFLQIIEAVDGLAARDDFLLDGEYPGEVLPDRVNALFESAAFCMCEYLRRYKLADFLRRPNAASAPAATAAAVAGRNGVTNPL